jgi:hypothetical protein
MTDASAQARPAPRRWRLRFSLRTLVLIVLAYASLWTATELRGGRDFRSRIETQSDALRRATEDWSTNQRREADLWQQEISTGFAQGQEPQEPGAKSREDGTCKEQRAKREEVTSFCDVETLAVAPFVLRVQYTYGCTDAAGRSLPPTLSRLHPEEHDAQGWAVWFFGYVLRIGGGT